MVIEDPRRSWLWAWPVMEAAPNCHSATASNVMHVVGVAPVDWFRRSRETSQNSRLSTPFVTASTLRVNGNSECLEDAEYTACLAYALAVVLSWFVIRTKSFPLHVPRAPILQEVGNRLQWHKSAPTDSPRKPYARDGSAPQVTPPNMSPELRFPPRPCLSFAGVEGQYGTIGKGMPK